MQDQLDQRLHHRLHRILPQGHRGHRYPHLLLPRGPPYSEGSLQGGGEGTWSALSESTCQTAHQKWLLDHHHFNLELLYEPLEEAFGVSDCISLNLPKVEKPIISQKTAKYLKPGVVIINTARGGLIDLNTLKEGLQSGVIAGAGLDVFDSEPPDQKMILKDFRQVILTPHQAGLSAESAKRMSLKSVQNIIDFFNGNLDSNLVVNGVTL